MSDTVAARLVSEKRLTDIVVDLLTRVNVPSDHARKAAYVLVTAEMRGIVTHGLTLLAGNLNRLWSGSLNPRPDIRPVGEFGAFSALDGDNGMGMIVGAVGMELAIEKAREFGVGWVTQRHSNHYGASGPFAMMAVDAGMIGVSITNTGPLIAVYGSKSRSIGNNPIAIGAPGPEFPVVLDMAMSYSALARIMSMETRGEPIPAEWYTGPLRSSREMVLSPIAGPKGSGLAIMMEILTSIAASGIVPHPGDETAHAQIAVDPLRAIPADRYDETMREFVARLKSAELAEGFDAVRLPGELEWLRTAKCRREGIPLDAKVIADLDAAAEKLGTTLVWS